MLGVGETVEDAVCADERSVCMIQLCRPRVGTREGETGFCGQQAKGCGLEYREGNGSHEIILIRERTWSIRS